MVVILSCIGVRSFLCDDHGYRVDRYRHIRSSTIGDISSMSSRLVNEWGRYSGGEKRLTGRQSALFLDLDLGGVSGLM